MSGGKAGDDASTTQRAPLWWWILGTVVGVGAVAAITGGLVAVVTLSSVSGAADERVNDRLPAVQSAVEEILRPFDSARDVRLVGSCNGDWTGHVVAFVDVDPSRATGLADELRTAAIDDGWQPQSGRPDALLTRSFSGLEFRFEVLEESSTGSGVGPHDLLRIRASFAGLEDCG